MRSIDVVVLTKNSEHLLEKCLLSIYQNVPVKNLIVIDGFSTDKTLKIVDETAKKYGNVKVLTVEGTRARAREKGIQQVTTDWFMFVDSDVVLCKNWFRKAEKHLAADVGAVWGVNIDVIPNMRDRRILKLQNLIARQCFGLRGGMHDTLIRREVVQDIHIPEQLHAYEDAYIVNWIRDKGYKIVVGDEIYCLHFKPSTNWRLQNGVSQAIIDFRCGVLYSRLYSYIFYYPIFMMQWFLQLSIHGARSLSTSQCNPKLIR
ncbi:MAG: glycosyltransferase family 2 protein [Candidatus Bathyarchaeota archaeon]|nr:glycosyltransferase family 2 protein [Candidatus Bathyarchaeota archaeon]